MRSRGLGPDEAPIEIEELDLAAIPELDALPRKPVPSLFPLVRIIGISVVMVLLVVLVWSSRWGQEHLAGRPTHVFPERTGDALIFNDGDGGIVILDLDSRLVVRRY